MSAIAKRETSLEVVPNGPDSVRPGGQSFSIMEEVIVKGDLAALTGDERAKYYMEVCRSIGLNPLTKPFEYIELNKKMMLYATKTATDQLRNLHRVSIYRIDEKTDGDLRIVHAYGRGADGREDMEIGAVFIKGLSGESLANAHMKAMTKAKRRLTLAMCGLGWLDESELEAIADVRRVNVNLQTGEIIDTDGGDDSDLAKSMRWLHAAAKEKDIDHDALHDLAVAAFGVPSLSECTVGQLNGLNALIKGCATDDVTTVISVAQAIDTAGEAALVNDIAQQAAGGDLPDIAKRLIAATAKRVGESLPA